MGSRPEFMTDISNNILVFRLQSGRTLSLNNIKYTLLQIKHNILLWAALNSQK